MDRTATFNEFKDRCRAEGFLEDNVSPQGDDTWSGIHDDGALRRFLRARDFDVDKALEQYKTTRQWRDANNLIALYDDIDVSEYEETRKMYTHWTGRRDREGSPICLFEIRQLTPSVMAAYEESCSKKVRQQTSTESEAMLRLFCTYESLVRFVFPLCSAVSSRPEPELPVTKTTSIIDISGVSLMQSWRLRSHMAAASTLATAHYPETLGRTYVIGAPSFFPTIWTWISRWFDQNTVSKIRIVPHGQECSMLSESIDPANIPHGYGGQHQFKFGMLPDLDQEIKDLVDWLPAGEGGVLKDMPKGPLRWVSRDNERRTVIAVGTVNGSPQNLPVMALRS